MAKKKPKHAYTLEKVECDRPSDYKCVESVLGDIHPIHEIHLDIVSRSRGPSSRRIRAYAGQCLYIVHGHVELNVPEPAVLESGDLIRVNVDTDFEALLDSRRALIAIFNWHDYHEEEVQKKWDSHRKIMAQRAKRKRPNDPDPDLSPIEQCLDLFLLEFKPFSEQSDPVNVLFLPNHVPTPQFCKRWEGVSVTGMSPYLPDYTRVSVIEKPDDKIELMITHGCTSLEYWRWEFSICYGKAEIKGKHFLDSRM